MRQHLRGHRHHRREEPDREDGRDRVVGQDQWERRDRARTLAWDREEADIQGTLEEMAEVEIILGEMVEVETIPEEEVYHRMANTTSRRFMAEEEEADHQVLPDHRDLRGQEESASINLILQTIRWKQCCRS